MALLKRGLVGEPVKILQQKLGVPADGDFGPGTETALKDYQKANGLQVDGIAGPDTFAEMGLHELILLTVGTRGTTVTKMQKALGITADGQFGAGTEKALREYQQKNGLDADGMAGPVTLAKMQLFAEITPEVVRRSQLGAEAVSSAGAANAPSGAPPVPKRSIWSTIKGLFN